MTRENLAVCEQEKLQPAVTLVQSDWHISFSLNEKCSLSEILKCIDKSDMRHIPVFSYSQSV